MLPYPLNSTIHPRLWSAVACHRFSYCRAPVPSAPLDLRARSLSRPGRGGLCIKSDLALRYVPNSFALYPFGDPHPLNPAVSISCRNGGGGCTRSRRSRPKPFTINTYTTVPPAAANKRLTPRLSPLDARFTKTQGVGVVTDNQK